MAKVLVTGAAGKIGHVLMSELVAQGHEPIGLYRTRTGSGAAAIWRKADITRPETYAALLEGCDAVIHLAVEFRRDKMDAVNVEATRELLVAARAARVRYFGFASSIVVYGSPRRREVTEETPLIDLGRPMIRQYLANPLMLDYARTKIQAEKALIADAVGMTIDIYRPTVVVNMDELLQVGDWSTGRKARSAHRTTQYITTIDVAAAICYLMKRGLSAPVRGFTEVYNLADDTAGTYSQLLDKAFGATKHPRFQTKIRLPALADRIKDFLQYRNLKPRTSLGRLRVSNAKLRETGFVFPLGMNRALDQVLTEEVRRARPIAAGD